MSSALSLPGFMPALRGHAMADGPVRLWLAVLSDTGELMGAAPVWRGLETSWKDGRLALAYGTVMVVITVGGTYDRAAIVAVGAQAWQALTVVPLDGPPQKLKPGDTMTVRDGLIAVDFSGSPPPLVR